MKIEDRVEKWIASITRRSVPRTGSLIVTIYGDTIAPHGEAVGLGSLIDLVEPLGFGDRLVRTTVNRLANDGWLDRTRVGRKSFYGLTTTGRQRIEHASRRIYIAPRDEWDAQWLIVILDTRRRDGARQAKVVRELHWEGFGTLAHGVLAHPAPDVSGVRELLQEANAVVFSARSLSGVTNAPLRDLVWKAWQLDDVARLYRGFIHRFQPIARVVERDNRLAGQQAFVVRTLLIHEYRRVLLRDPQLPDALLPAGWPGRAARQLCAATYRATLDASERHAREILETVRGRLPPAAPHFYERFGGLLQSAETRAHTG